MKKILTLGFGVFLMAQITAQNPGFSTSSRQPAGTNKSTVTTTNTVTNTNTTVVTEGNTATTIVKEGSTSNERTTSTVNIPEHYKPYMQKNKVSTTTTNSTDAVTAVETDKSSNTTTVTNTNTTVVAEGSTTIEKSTSTVNIPEHSNPFVQNNTVSTAENNSTNVVTAVGTDKSSNATIIGISLPGFAEVVNDINTLLNNYSNSTNETADKVEIKKLAAKYENMLNAELQKNKSLTETQKTEIQNQLINIQTYK